MDEDKPFTVRDRRKFTAEGDLKTDAGEAPSAPQAEPAAPPRPDPEPPTTEASVEPPPASGAPEPASPVTEPDDASRGAGPGEERVDFAGFLVSLATQASMLLSTSEGDARENLRGAQHLIGILEMLEGKTRGNRTAEEDQVLRQLLYELRMAWVERSRTVSP